MIKKLSILIVATYFIATTAAVGNAALLGYGVGSLIPAGATTSGGITTIPARLIGHSAAGSISKWGKLAIPGVGMARIGVILAAVGASIAGDYIYDECSDWFNRNGYDRYLNRSVTMNLPPGQDGSKYYNPGKYNQSGWPSVESSLYNMPIKYIDLGIFPNQTAALNAVNAFWSSNFCTLAPSGFFNSCVGISNFVGNPNMFITTYYKNNVPTGFPSSGAYGGKIIGGGMNVYSQVRGYAYKIGSSGTGRIGYAPLAWYTGGTTNPSTFKRPATEAELEDDMNTKGDQAMRDGIMRAAKYALEGTEFRDADAARSKQLNDTLAGYIPAAELADLEDAIGGEEELPGQQEAANTTAAVIAALQAQGLSASQIADAINSGSTSASGGVTKAEVQEAMTNSLAVAGLSAENISDEIKTKLNDETGIEVPVDQDSIIPEKLSLTSVLQSFMNSIATMPIFQTLQGLTINVSGSSSLCLNLTSSLGVNYCFDASGFQDQLNMIGSALLGLVTIFSFINIFKS